jgi:hypothetical protein
VFGGTDSTGLVAGGTAGSVALGCA